jgi:hypothetical protein
MAKFRKKPIVIEAFQWNGETVRGFQMYWKEGDPVPKPPYLAIPTLEGVMEASVGDWIITGIKGEVYPCKPDIFEATYEPVLDNGFGLVPYWKDMLEQVEAISRAFENLDTHVSAIVLGSSAEKHNHHEKVDKFRARLAKAKERLTPKLEGAE